MFSFHMMYVVNKYRIVHFVSDRHHLQTHLAHLTDRRKLNTVRGAKRHTSLPSQAQIEIHTTKKQMTKNAQSMK